jgi:hypothetical protein
MGQCNRVLVTWMAHCAVTHPDKSSFTPSNSAERAWFEQEHRRITLALARREQLQTSYDLSAPVQTAAAPDLASVIPFAPRRDARRRERRSRAGRSSARSGDSGDDPAEPDPDGWRWRQPTGWGSFVASVQSRDFERELHRERMAGWSR